MRSRWIGLAAIALILVCLALGGLVQRSRRPGPTPVIEIELPAVPADNAYDDFVEATKSLPSPPEFSWQEDAPLPAEARKALNRSTAALDAIREALAKPCAAPIATSFEQKFPELRAFRSAAYLFVMQSRHARHSGRAADCVEPLHTALRFAQAVGVRADVMHRLRSLAMEAITLGELRHAINSGTLSPEQLQGEIKFLEELEATEPPLEQVVEAEFQGTRAGALQYDRQLKAGGRRLPLLLGYNPKALIRRLEQDRHDALSFIELPYSSVPPPLPQRAKGGFRIPSVTAVIGDTTSGTFIFGCRSVIRSHMRTSSGRRGTQLLAAVELHRSRHGGLPGTLQELQSMKLQGVEAMSITDPLSEKPFIYRLNGDDYWLYSVGDNLTDDGGRPRRPGQSNVEDDVVFHRPATAEGDPNT